MAASNPTQSSKPDNFKSSFSQSLQSIPPYNQMNPSSNTSSSSNPVQPKPARGKGKSTGTNSRASSSNSSPTTTSGNVLPKGISSTGSDAPLQICSNCQTTSTPLWRRDGKGGLCCNSCQLWAKTKGYPRPMSLKTDVIKPRIRQSKGGPKKKTKKQLALEAANGGDGSTASPTKKQTGRSQADGLISGETSPDLTNRESSPASSRSYSRSCSGSASPPLTGSGRPSMEGYNHSMSHSQHLPTPPSGLHHSTTSSNSSVNLPSLSRLLAETGQHGQQQHQSGGHQSAPNSHRPSLDGPTGTWSPPVGDAEQEAAYALARRAGKLPEGQAYVSHPQYPSHSQRTISRRGSVPSLFGTGGVGHHSSNVRGGESGSASGESSPMSSSHTKSGEDPSDYYSNPNGAGRPMPPLKRERDISDGDLKPPGVNIPGVSSHHASNLVDDRERRGRSGPDAEGLRFGVSPRSRADVDAGFARGRPYSSLRDSETNPLFNNGRYSPGPGPMPAGTGAGAQTLERPPGVATKGPGSRSHSQLPPSLGSTDHHSRQPAPSSRSSSTGRVPGGGNSETRASSLSRIDSSSNHSSPRGSPFASPRGSPSRTMEPLPQHHHHHPHPHHHLHSQVNPQHPHAFHPYSSPNHSPLLNARDGLPVGGHPHLPLSSLHLHHQPASIAHHSAAAALDVLGAAASERLKDEGLTSRSTVPSTLAPSNTASNTSSPLNPHPNGPTHHPLTAPTSPQQPSEQLRGRSLQASWAIHEGSVYWARRANAEGPAICAYHQTHNNTSSDDPAESMDLDPPAHGAQPQLRYLDCGCSPDEVLFEIACERKGIKGLDPKSRRNLLSLERKRNGYKEGDWEE